MDSSPWRRLAKAEAAFDAIIARRRTTPVGDGEILQIAHDLETARQASGIAGQLFGEFPPNELAQARWVAQHYQVNVTKIPATEVSGHLTADCVAGAVFAEFKEITTQAESVVRKRLSHASSKRATIAVFTVKDRRMSDSLLTRVAERYIGRRRLRTVVFLRRGKVLICSKEDKR